MMVMFGSALLTGVMRRVLDVIETFDAAFERRWEATAPTDATPTSAEVTASERARQP